MVLLHGLEHGELPVRETADADVLVDVRVTPAGTRTVSRWLLDQGLVLDGVSPDGIGHRFTRVGLTVDVVVPNGLGPNADLRTVSPARTIEVPGGSRLLRDVQRVRVDCGKVHPAIPRPSLPAALVGKAAALALPDAARHRQDLAFLLGLVTDLQGVAASTSSASDKRVLRRAAKLIEADDRCWEATARPEDAKAALHFLAT